MDVYEAVDSRRAVLDRVLAAATRAPSSGNLQPWHLYVRR
ncbi:nitroreductase family protein [Actinoplanes sp. NPDC026670]